MSFLQDSIQMRSAGKWTVPPAHRSEAGTNMPIVEGKQPPQNATVADLRLIWCRTRLGWWSQSEGGGDKTSRWYGPDRAKFLGEHLLLVLCPGGDHIIGRARLGQADWCSPSGVEDQAVRAQPQPWVGSHRCQGWLLWPGAVGQLGRDRHGKADWLRK